MKLVGKTEDGTKLTVDVNLKKIVVIGGHFFYLGTLSNEYGCKRMVLESINDPGEISLQKISEAKGINTIYEIVGRD